MRWRRWYNTLIFAELSCQLQVVLLVEFCAASDADLHLQIYLFVALQLMT